MSQFLPTGGFNWVKNVDEPEFWNVPDDSPVGYVLEVDLHYPESLHDAHNDIPFCSEHMRPPGSKQEKLLTTLYDKNRYVIHYRALKQALEHGLVLNKVHRALEFRQSPFLKSYVDLNTEKRKMAKNEFEKMFFKLLINAIYGKCMENERKRLDVKLVFKWPGRYSAEALIAKPNFHSRAIFNENLVAIQLSRTEITIRKPIYIGLCVLDISKTLMYDFHYSFMRQKFGDKCRMMYTDTDSFIYHIKGANIYEVIKENIDKFDTSDYPENNQFGIPRKNKKVIGLFKDETCSKIIESVIGLRSKMYSVKIQGEDTIKKAKGVKTRVVKNKITYEDYKDCLFNQTIKKVHQNTIRSRLHVVRTEKQEKIALSPHDDKRHLLPNDTNTLSWGHWSIIDEDLLDEFATENSGEFFPEIVSEQDSNSSLENVLEENVREEVFRSFENVGEVGETLHKEDDPSASSTHSTDELRESPLPKRRRYY